MSATLVFRGEELPGTCVVSWTVGTQGQVNVTTRKRMQSGKVAPIIESGDLIPAGAVRTPIGINTRVDNSDDFQTVMAAAVTSGQKYANKIGELYIRESGTDTLIARKAACVSVSASSNNFVVQNNYLLQWGFIAVDGGGGMTYFEDLNNGGFESLSAAGLIVDGNSWTVTNPAQLTVEQLYGHELIGTGQNAISMIGHASQVKLSQAIAAKAGFTTADYGDYYLRMTFDCAFELQDDTVDTTTIHADIFTTGGGSIAGRDFTITSNQANRLQLAHPIYDGGNNLYTSGATFELLMNASVGDVIWVDNVTVEEVHVRDL